jgi:signal transduction histidine kinase
LRLADFIETNTEAILADWVAFASTSGPAGKTMDLTALRDHALEMLKIIVEDLRTPQTQTEQKEKSKGKTDIAPGSAETAAEVHGAGRAASGFTLGEMVSEYRALRASVIRLWVKSCGTLDATDLEDLMRFNEAVDQSTAESITRFTQDLDQSKEMFIAILGHDLRTPLGAVIMGSQFMLDKDDLSKADRDVTTRIVRSGRRMNQMIADLLDFTRSRLGGGIPIVRQRTDLAKAGREAVDEIAGAHPDSLLQFTSVGDAVGDWDAARLGQVLTNLLANAVQHGKARSEIIVTVDGRGEDVELRVHNNGPPIEKSVLEDLFKPLKRASDAAHDTSSLGLGLYIAERIVTAHEGKIDVQSSAESGTTFTVRLPRKARSPA